MEKVEQFVPNPLRCYRCKKKNMDTMRTHVEDGKCAGNGAKEIPATTWMNVNFPINVRIVLVTIRSMQDLAIFGGEKEILAVKYKNNIPYHEARKRVVGSNTYTYSQAVQRGKNEIKYEEMVKKLIQLDPSDLGKLY